MSRIRDLIDVNASDRAPHGKGWKSLEWSEDGRRMYPLDGEEVVRIWRGRAMGQSWATAIECTDGEFTLLSDPVSGRYPTLAAAQEVAQGNFERHLDAQLDVRGHALLLDLSDAEHDVVLALGREMDLSSRAVMRQALRLYQLVQTRIKAGESFQFSGDAERLKAFAGGAMSTDN